MELFDQVILGNIIDWPTVLLKSNDPIKGRKRDFEHFTWFTANQFPISNYPLKWIKILLQGTYIITLLTIEKWNFPYFYNITLGAIHTRSPQSERGVVQCGHFAYKEGGWFFRYGRPHFFGRKTSNFSKFMMCPHGQRELSHCGHFSDNGGGVHFSRFYADAFYGRPITNIVQFTNQPF